MTGAHAPSVHQPVPRDPHPQEAAGSPAAEPRERRRPDPQRASSLDHLMVGAPLTAAALGLLLTDGGVAGEALAGAEGAASARTVDPSVGRGGEPANGSATSPAPRAEPGVDGAVATGQGAPMTGTVAAAGAGEATTATVEAAAEGAAQGIGVPDPASLASGAEAGVVGGASLSITFGSAGDGSAGLAPGVDGAPAPDERGDIGGNVQAGDGDDVIHGTDNDDVLSGGGGDDEIYGHGGDDLIDGGTGDDLLYGGAGDDRVLGGRGQDEIHGGSGDDDLLGGPGADRLFGEAGRDLLVGGTGDDLLDGGGGADRMIGGAGNDEFVMGGTHDVALEDGRSADAGGADTVRIGDAFTDSMPAGLAEDGATFVLSNDVDQVLPDGTAAYQQQLDPDVENVHLTGDANHDVVGNDAANRITGNAGDNALYGGAGQDVLIGGGGSDHLDGGAGSDKLKGGADDDILNGGLGRDHLEGGDGDDILDGGYGADQLYGQAGNDSFVVGLNDRAVDTIFDQEGVNQVVVTDGAGHDVEAVIAGNDMHVVVDHNPIAVIEGYQSENFNGVDTGSGTVTPESLLVENGTGPALPSPSAGLTSSGVAGGEDLLASYLGSRSHIGNDGQDNLYGTSGADWLTGLDGDDVLTGGDGHDVLEGGAGHDLLEGGLGDDRYLFSSGESGLDSIRDVDGSNHAELHGFTGAKVEGVMVGQDLVVIAHHAPIFKVENFAGHENSFAGIQNGDEFIAAEDLFG